MKYDEFLLVRNVLNDFVRRELILTRKNILGEVVEYDFQKNLTTKEKKEIKTVYENNIFVEKVEFSGTSVKIYFSTKVNYADIADYLLHMQEFTERLLPSSFVFDENKSVKWNREEVEKENEAIKERKLIDITSRKILKQTQKQAIIYEVIDFFGLSKVKYESIEILYDYLNGIYDLEDVAKNIYSLTETVLKFAESEKLPIKRN